MIEQHHIYIAAKIGIDVPRSYTYVMKRSQVRYLSDSAVAPLRKFNLQVCPKNFFSFGRNCCIVGAA